VEGFEAGGARAIPWRFFPAEILSGSWEEFLGFTRRIGKNSGEE
jgi:hypothetical protein